MPTKEIIFEFDDFHFSYPENCLDIIQYLKTSIPGVKINLFTTPMLRGEPLYNDMQWCKQVRELIESGTVVLGVHGLNHYTLEFKDKSYDQAINSLSLALGIFKQANLPIQKVFRGPHWGICFNTINALKDLGFTHVYNHEDYKHLECSGIKFKYYNWNLKDSPPEENLLIAHGHTHNVCGNGIREKSHKIIEFCQKHTPIFKALNES